MAYPFPSAATEALVDSSTERLRRLYPISTPKDGTSFKTTVTYFQEGRVKVTFIVDTILVVMLTEVISQWFKGGDWQALTVLCGILLILGVVRIMAVRWSPTLKTGAPEVVPH